MSDLSKYFGDEGFAPDPNDQGDEFSIIPTGWYPAEITGVKIEETKSGSGARFVVEFTILGEKFSNRKVWNGNGFNFINKSQTAQAIGQRELGRLTTACGFNETDRRLKDEDDLLGRTLEINVITEAASEHYDKPRNVAEKFRATGSGGATSAPRPATPPPIPHTASAPAPKAEPQNAQPAPEPTEAGRKRLPWEELG